MGNPGRESVLSVLNLAVRRIQETAQAIRVMSNDLRPPVLDDLGVASALRWFGRDFGDSYPGLTVSTVIEVEDRQVPDRLTTTIFRCVQELLNNVAKHSRADAATVSLRLGEEGLTLRVEDNGVGISASGESPRSRGSGLRNLKERAQMTGGRFNVIAAPRGGLVAELLWPLHDEEPQLLNSTVSRKPARRRKAASR
jgi:two-component system NarL family sensor kinase